MKKLYRKGTVHPSPPTVSDKLSFLPATILTLTVALSPEDKEVLAYLISCSFSSSSVNGNSRRKTKSFVDGEHFPLFHCNCFRCYMSYWVRWNTSPNHQLIHRIIDDFEDFLSQNANKRKEKKNKKGSSNNSNGASESNRSELESVTESSGGSNIVGVINVNEGSEFINSIEVEEVENEEKLGSVRKILRFIGERIWGRWINFHVPTQKKLQNQMVFFFLFHWTLFWVNFVLPFSIYDSFIFFVAFLWINVLKGNCSLVSVSCYIIQQLVCFYYYSLMYLLWGFSFSVTDW